MPRDAVRKRLRVDIHHIHTPCMHVCTQGTPYGVRSTCVNSGYDLWFFLCLMCYVSDESMDDGSCTKYEVLHSEVYV